MKGVIKLFSLRKYFIIALILAISTFPGYTQLLKGEWEGSFTQDGNKWPIYLEFKLNADTTYSVYSYSKGLTIKGVDTVITCLVHYELISQDSLYLEEIEAIEPNKYLSATCFQKMFLQIKRYKKYIELVGEWESSPTHCNSSGKISFRKKLL